jgi:hypothetical protein
VVYLDITNGRIICNGVNGTANKAKESFVTPFLINCNPVIASVAAKPT